jgi:pyruvate dehydrogenase E1 component alpha subunit
MRKCTREQLIQFEQELLPLVEAWSIPGPVHLCGGNEDKLIEIFEGVEERDWVISTHRNHYHYLLKTGDVAGLREHVLAGRSIQITNRQQRFLSSAILASGCALGCGIASVMQEREPGTGVLVFVGDGASDNGKFVQSVRYAAAFHLPVRFVLEMNRYSCDTEIKARWNGFESLLPRNEEWWREYVLEYEYTRIYPHVGSGWGGAL